VALHRSRDVTQDDDRARAPAATPPDPLDEVAAGAEVAPKHGPGREPPAVRVELVAPGEAGLETGAEQVDQPLGVAELGVCHPVEVAMTERFAGTEGAWRDDPAGVGFLLLVAGARLGLLGSSARWAGSFPPALRVEGGLAILRRPGRPWGADL
jgi:hypothetical protein